MVKNFTNLAMSKGVGKVLNSGVGKVGVKVGNAVIRGAKAPGNLVASAIKRESAMNKAADTKYRKEAPRGAKGK